MKKEALTRLTHEQREKTRKVCIRINNPSSMAVNMKVLGVIPTGFKAIDHSMIGSRETNFNMETVVDIEPFFNAYLIKEWLIKGKVKVFLTNVSINDSKVLIPFNAGDQGDLEDGVLEQNLKSVMKTHYIKGIFRASDLGLKGDSYFYAEVK